jgi:transcriptional regulator with XRE-family HTH domain
MMSRSKIAEKLKRARKKAGLSQDRLARKADVAYNTVVKIESGENKNPTIETLRKLAKALNMPIDKLIN